MITKALVRDGNNQVIQRPSSLVFMDAVGYESPIHCERVDPSDQNFLVSLTPPDNSIELVFRSLDSDIKVSIPGDFEHSGGEYLVLKGEEGSVPCLDGRVIDLAADNPTVLYFKFKVV